MTEIMLAAIRTSKEISAGIPVPRIHLTGQCHDIAALRSVDSHPEFTARCYFFGVRQSLAFESRIIGAAMELISMTRTMQTGSIDDQRMLNQLESLSLVGV